MNEKERFTVDSDGKYWDKINHKYINLDYLFRLVDELDTKLDNKQHTINEMAKTIRIYDDAYINLNKKYKELVDENKQLKRQKENEIEWLKKENKELRQDNDIKFWKLQCMHYFNANSLFMSEISRAIKKGYEVSEQFQKYLDELKEDTKKIKEKNKRLFGDSDD